MFHVVIYTYTDVHMHMQDPYRYNEEWNFRICTCQWTSEYYHFHIQYIHTLIVWAMIWSHKCVIGMSTNNAWVDDQVKTLDIRKLDIRVSGSVYTFIRNVLQYTKYIAVLKLQQYFSCTKGLCYLQNKSYTVTYLIYIFMFTYIYTSNDTTTIYPKH